MAHHALADAARGLLIVFEPALQLPGRQRRRGQRRQQARGMLGVGARQRRHDPVGHPARQCAAAHRRQRRIRQTRQQVQAPADPAHIPAAPLCHRVLRQPQPLHQFAQQQGLLDDREPTVLIARQQRPAAPRSGRTPIAPRWRCRGPVDATQQPADSHRPAPALPRRHRRRPPPRCRARSGRTARWTAPSAPPRAAPPDGCRQNAGPGDAGQARGNGGAWASSPAARSAHPCHVRQDLRLDVGRDHHGGLHSVRAWPTRP